MFGGKYGKGMSLRGATTVTTVFAIALVLFLAQIGEARATVECENNQTCGKDCCWAVENGTLKITGNESGTGVMNNFALYGQPWYNLRNDVTSIEVSGVSNLGGRAFQYLKNATSLNMSDSVKTIAHRAFFASGINSVDLSNITKLDDYAFFHSETTEIIVSDTLAAETVAKWGNSAFYINSSYAQNISGIKCIDANGNKSTKQEKCIEALERFLPDEDGNCKEGIRCLKNLQKIGSSCVGQYFSNGENTCISKSSCVQNGNVIKFESRECMSSDACKETYAIDSETHHCNKIAGCSSFVDGACVCDKYYYKRGTGCISFAEGCGEGWLEKNGECIEESKGCGNGYKNLGGWCNRVIYTPTEAAQLLMDKDNTFTITFKK